MNKPIVVIDSNVYISSLFWKGNPYHLVKRAVNQDIKSIKIVTPKQFLDILDKK